MDHLKSIPPDQIYYTWNRENILQLAAERCMSSYDAYSTGTNFDHSTLPDPFESPFKRVQARLRKDRLRSTNAESTKPKPTSRGTRRPSPKRPSTGPGGKRRSEYELLLDQRVPPLFNYGSHEFDDDEGDDDEMASYTFTQSGRMVHAPKKTLLQRREEVNNLNGRKGEVSLNAVHSERLVKFSEGNDGSVDDDSEYDDDDDEQHPTRDAGKSGNSRRRGFGTSLSNKRSKKVMLPTLNMGETDPTLSLKQTHRKQSNFGPTVKATNASDNRKRKHDMGNVFGGSSSLSSFSQEAMSPESETQFDYVSGPQEEHETPSNAALMTEIASHSEGSGSGSDMDISD
ncbi:hypothetical protein FRC03_006976 [Tulasnella sp. 419]|nr:hypothetical protein FRC03_006976 [Tulasnella sp. 419]